MKKKHRDTPPHHVKKLTKKERQALESIKSGEKPHESNTYVAHLLTLGLITYEEGEYELTDDGEGILDNPDPMSDEPNHMFDGPGEPTETFDTPNTGDGYSPGDF